jgi:O-antigen/teichoic acid export membrane protein
MGRLHVGMCAHMLMFRLDQVLLARLAGAGALGVYALAVAALEFAQAGAVVAAQRILATHSTEGSLDPRPMIKATVPIGVLAVIGLALLGLVLPDYRHAWLLGLILLPGAVAIAVDKTWSANLLKRRGERATTAVALVALAAAVGCYSVLIPGLGAVGAAIASSFVYAVQAAGTRYGLRRRPLTVRTA